MQEIVVANKCTGCGSCMSVCPKDCISMSEDDNGFLYPHINNDVCVNCNLCKNRCPVLNEVKANETGKAYACINTDEKIRSESSSGGMFTLIAEYVIEQGGVVFGAALDENMEVYHSEASTKIELRKFRGSKYVQSKIGDTYKRAKKYLDEGRMVLFTGTPCQIGGLYASLNKKYENLITQDIICHGVPAPKVWRRYLKYQLKSHQSDNTKEVRFRNKDNGWLKYSMKIDFDNGKEYKMPFVKDKYMNAFLSELCLRDSCYECSFKSMERQSDITLADFWGVNEIMPEMFDDKGTSLVVVNTKKAEDIFTSISDKVKVMEVKIEDAVRYNPSMYKSVVRHPKREKFLEMIDVMSFDNAVDKCLKVSFIKKVYNKLRSIKRKICK